MMLANLGLQSTRKHLCSMDVNMPCVWPMDTEPLPAAAGAKPCLAPPWKKKRHSHFARLECFVRSAFGHSMLSSASAAGIRDAGTLQLANIEWPNADLPMWLAANPEWRFSPCGAFQSAINVSTCERTACGNGPQLLARGICLHRSPRRHQLVSGYFPSRAAMNWGPAVFQAPPPSIGSGCLSSRAVFKWGPATFNWFRLSFKPRHLQLGSGYLSSRAAITWFPAIFQAAPPSTGVHLSFTTSALPPIRPFVTSPDRFLERNSDRELRWREKPMGYFKLTRVLASAPDSSGRNTQNGQIVTLQTPEFQRYDSHDAVFLMENDPKTRNRNVGYFFTIHPAKADRSEGCGRHLCRAR